MICTELAAGRQMILLRKGGIREPAGGFAVDHHEFFLFPTYVHQNEDELVAAAQAALPAVARLAPPAGELRLDLYATVETAIEVTSLEPLRRLEGEHALVWSAVERRFHYRRPGLHVIVLSVHRLARPLVVPHVFRYDGCRSWVALEEELPVSDAHPVLERQAFERRLQAIGEALAAGSPRSAHRSA